MFSDPTVLLMYFGIPVLLGNIVGGTVLFASRTAGESVPGEKRSYEITAGANRKRPA